LSGGLRRFKKVIIVAHDPACDVNQKQKAAMMTIPASVTSENDVTLLASATTSRNDSVATTINCSTVCLTTRDSKTMGQSVGTAVPQANGGKMVTLSRKSFPQIVASMPAGREQKVPGVITAKNAALGVSCIGGGGGGLVIVKQSYGDAPLGVSDKQGLIPLRIKKTAGGGAGLTNTSEPDKQTEISAPSKDDLAKSSLQGVLVTLSRKPPSRGAEIERAAKSVKTVILLGKWGH
jgi:hypothetical protein